MAKQQSETMQILTLQNVRHEELMKTHFETFIKMKDKESVGTYMKDFLRCSAYLGYANFDIEKLTQVLRRIYHTPEEVDVSELLDYLVLLALSRKYYKEFDEKSIAFIDASLEYIENKFNGFEHLDVKVPNEVTGEMETMTLKYYKNFTTENRIYQKV